MSLKLAIQLSEAQDTDLVYPLMRFRPMLLRRRHLVIAAICCTVSHASCNKSGNTAGSTDVPVPGTNGNVGGGDDDKKDDAKIDPSANAKTREAVIADVVTRLTTAGLGAGDVATVKAAMLAAGQSFGLTAGQSLEEMMAAMVKAAMVSLGTIDSVSSNPALRKSSIKEMTSSFIGFTTQQKNGSTNLLESIKMVTSAIAATLKQAKVSDTELTEILESTTAAAVAEKSTDKGLLASLAVGAVSAMTDGLKAAGFPAATVANSLSGVTKGALIAAAKGGVAVDQLGDMSKGMIEGIQQSLTGSEINVEAALSHALAGVQVGATAAGVAANKIQAIVDKAHEAAPDVEIAILETPKTEVVGPTETKDPGEFVSIRFTDSMFTKAPVLHLKAEQQAEETFPSYDDKSYANSSVPTDAELQNFDPATLVIFDGAAALNPTIIVKTGHKYNKVRYAISTIDNNYVWGDWQPVGATFDLSIGALADGQHTLFAQASIDGNSLSEVTQEQLVIRRVLVAATLRDPQADAGASKGDGGFQVQVDGDGIAGYKYWVSSTAGHTCTNAVFPTYWLKEYVNIGPSNPPADFHGLNYYGDWEGRISGNNVLFESKTYVVCLRIRDRAGNEQTTATSMTYNPRLEFFPEAVTDTTSVTIKQAPALPGMMDGADDYRLVARGATFHVLSWKHGVGLKSYDSVNGGVNWTDRGLVFDDSTSVYGGISAAAASPGGIAVTLWKGGQLTVLFSSDGVVFTAHDIETALDFSWSNSSVVVTSTKILVGYDSNYTVSLVDHAKLMFASAAISSLNSWTKVVVEDYSDIGYLTPSLSVNGSNAALVAVPAGYGIPFLHTSSNEGAVWSAPSVVGAPLAPDPNDNYDHQGINDSMFATVSLLSSGATIAVTLNHGVFKRDFTGTAWTWAHRDVEDVMSEENKPSDRLYFEPQDTLTDGSSLLYFATTWQEQNGARFRRLVIDQSSNLSSWTRYAVADDTPYGMTPRFAASGANILALFSSYAGKVRLVRSSDSGVSWNTAPTPVTIAGVSTGRNYDGGSAFARTTTHHYALNGSELSRSANGTAWERLGRFAGHNDSYGTLARQVAASGSNVYVTSYGWLARSSDGGVNWTGKSFDTLPLADYGSFDVKTFADGDDVWIAYSASYSFNATSFNVLKLAHSSDAGVTFASPVDLTGSHGSHQFKGMNFSGSSLVTAWESDDGMGTYTLQVRRHTLGGSTANLPPLTNVDDNYAPFGSFLLAATDAKVSVLSEGRYFENGGSTWSTAFDVTPSIGAGFCEKSMQMVNGEPGLLIESPGILQLAKRAANATWSATVIDSADANGCGSLTVEGTTAHILYPSAYLDSMTKYTYSSDGGTSFTDPHP